MAQAVAHTHDDYMHDCQYDYYGRRLATCSSDQRIKIWAQQGGVDGAWAAVASWKAHYGPVWRLNWAHPEFGQLLASCSSDHNVLVWEEQEGVDDAGRVVSRWHKRAQLGDARDSVNDVKFAPRHLGLKLAAGSADGAVRVYEAGDILSLAHWEFTDEFASEPSQGGGVTSLSWCTSPFDTPMLAVGGASGSVKVWGYSAGARKWLQMLELSGHNSTINSSSIGVTDVAWAPNVGRSFHLIASAGRDGRLCLWRLQPEATADAAGTGASGSSSSEGSNNAPTAAAAPVASVRKLPGSSADASHLATFSDHCGLPVWRCDWNVTGTVLASSGDDGTFKLRKQTMSGKWELVSSIDRRAAGHNSNNNAVADGNNIAVGHAQTYSYSTAGQQRLPLPSSFPGTGPNQTS